MESRPHEIVPLTEKEKGFLLLIYRKRRKVLLTAYAIMFMLAVYYCPSGNNTRQRGTGKVTRRWDENEDSKYISSFGMDILKIGFIGTILFGTGIYFFITTVYSFKRDADSGVKERIFYSIVRKEYFPLTNQFYLAIDDPDYLHHEIDAEMYAQCSEGDTISMYRAIKSKFVFEDNGRYSL